MKRRILSLLLLAAMGLALLAGCGSKDAGANPSDEPSAAQSAEPSEAPDPAPSETVAPEVSAPPEETDEPSAEPSQAPEPSATPTPAPTPTPTPAATPTPEPAPSAPQIVIPGFGTPSAPPEEPSKPGDSPVYEPTGPSASDKDLTAFYATISGKYDFNMEILPDDFLSNYYPGLTAIPVVQRLVCTPMMSSVASEIALIQVANSSDVAAVKAILQARIDSQVAGGAWYPQTIEDWAKNSQIVDKGNYIMLIVNPSWDEIVSDFSAYVK